METKTGIKLKTERAKRARSRRFNSSLTACCRHLTSPGLDTGREVPLLGGTTTRRLPLGLATSSSPTGLDTGLGDPAGGIAIRLYFFKFHTIHITGAPPPMCRIGVVGIKF